MKRAFIFNIITSIIKNRKYLESNIINLKPNIINIFNTNFFSRSLSNKAEKVHSEAYPKRNSS